MPRISLRLQPGVPTPSPILGELNKAGGWGVGGGDRGDREVVAASVREAGRSAQGWGGRGASCAAN